MQRLEVRGAVRPIYASLGVKRLTVHYEKSLANILTYIFRLKSKKRSETCHDNHSPGRGGGRICI